MDNSQQLQRTVVKDIVAFCEDSSIKDVMDAINTAATTGSKFLNGASARPSGSIVARTSQLVLVFPVLVSNAIKLETAVLISKAIEKKCVSLLQILFSAINLTEYNDTRDLYDYLAKFHTNLNVNPGAVTLDDFINAMDAMVASEAATVINKDAYDSIMTEMRLINSVAKDTFRESSVNDFTVTKTKFGQTIVSLEAGGASSGNNPQPNTPNPQARFMRVGDASDFFKSQIIPTDVNKVNELVPTMMMVNFITMKDGQAINRTGVIGVKAKMYPIESMELVGRISNKYTDSNTLFNLIKCSTKEKSFFKDFAFALEKTKMDAINIAKGSVNSKLFKTLENRATRNRSRLLRRGDASPITTLVISQEEVEYLKKYSNINLESPNAVKVVFNGYNLMGLVIVDDSIEVAKFLYDDGEGIFETLTYDALAKDDKNGDYKKIVNLMAKMNR